MPVLRQLLAEGVGIANEAAVSFLTDWERPAPEHEATREARRGQADADLERANLDPERYAKFLGGSTAQAGYMKYIKDA